MNWNHYQVYIYDLHALAATLLKKKKRRKKKILVRSSRRVFRISKTQPLQTYSRLILWYL